MGPASAAQVLTLTKDAAVRAMLNAIFLNFMSQFFA
jgi:hypothetical protein